MDKQINKGSGDQNASLLWKIRKVSLRYTLGVINKVTPSSIKKGGLL
jgi:hypothetical protein